MSQIKDAKDKKRPCTDSSVRMRMSGSDDVKKKEKKKEAVPQVASEIWFSPVRHDVT